MEGNLAYLKGALADGHVYDLKARIRIVVRQKDKKWLEDSILPILKNISGKEPKIIRTLDGVYMIYVYIHKSSLKQETIELLLNPLEETRFVDKIDELEFLRGFFDAEGSFYVSSKKNDKRIILYQKHRKMLEYIERILNGMNIPSKIYGPYKNGNSYIHRLIIFTEKNSEKFLREIKPLNEIKILSCCGRT